MKRELLFLLLIGILASCSNDAETIVETNTELNGNWKMTGYIALLPTLPEINWNEIEWTFDVENNQLTVINTVESEYPYILASGNYNIIVTNNSITISDVEYDYTILNGVLTLSDNIELDGPIMSFTSD